MKRYRVVQPYGRDVAAASTTVSEHDTLEQAFAEIDSMAAKMLRTMGRSDAVQLFVVDSSGKLGVRPDAN